MFKIRIISDAYFKTLRKEQAVTSVSKSGKLLYCIQTEHLRCA